MIHVGSVGTDQRGRKQRTIFASGPGPFTCLPGISAAFQLRISARVKP